MKCRRSQGFLQVLSFSTFLERLDFFGNMTGGARENKGIATNQLAARKICLLAEPFLSNVDIYPARGTYGGYAARTFLYVAADIRNMIFMYVHSPLLSYVHIRMSRLQILPFERREISSDPLPCEERLFVPILRCCNWHRIK